MVLQESFKAREKGQGGVRERFEPVSAPVDDERGDYFEASLAVTSHELDKWEREVWQEANLREQRAPRCEV